MPRKTPTTPTEKIISANVEILMKSRKVNTKELALGVGFSYSDIYDRINNHTNWRADILKAIAEYFDVSIDSICGNHFMDIPKKDIGNKEGKTKHSKKNLRTGEKTSV